MGAFNAVEQRRLCEVISLSLLRELFPTVPVCMPAEYTEENFAGLQAGDVVLSGSKLVVCTDDELLFLDVVEVFDDIESCERYLGRYGVPGWQTLFPNTNTAPFRGKEAEMSNNNNNNKVTLGHLENLVREADVAIQWDPSWANGTGYMDGLLKVRHPIQVGEFGAGADDTGRRFFVFNAGKGGPQIAVFQRYADVKSAEHCVVVTQYPGGDKKCVKLFEQVGTNANYSLEQLTRLFEAAGVHSAVTALRKAPAEVVDAGQASDSLNPHLRKQVVIETSTRGTRVLTANDVLGFGEHVVATAAAEVEIAAEDAAPTRGATAVEDTEWSTGKKVAVGVGVAVVVGLAAYGITRAMR